MDVSAVIAPHAAWLQRLRYAYGAGQGAFDRDIFGTLRRYAQYVHLLPATRDRHFRAEGGLFRMGLEIGFYALQATDGAIFSGQRTITERSSLEPRWRYATFVAGLCSGLATSLSQLRVCNDHGEEWPASLRPLALWLQETRCTRYHIRWLPRSDASAALGAAAMSQIVSEPMLQYLAVGNSIIVGQLAASITGSAAAGETGTLAELVRRASALVVEGELREHPGAAAVADDPPPQSRPWAGEPAAARVAPLTLIAPAHLHPTVRGALRQIIAALDSRDRPPAAWVIDAGVFVPLNEFERCGVNPALAVRALDEACMLAGDPSQPQSKTCVRAFAGESLLGIVVASHCVRGLDARLFAVPMVHGRPVHR